MKQGKWIIYLMTVLLALTAFRFWLSERRAMAPFSFQLETESGAEVVHYWTNEAGESYVFLPSFGSMKNLRLRTRSHIHFDELTLTDMESCQDLQLNRPYALSDGGTITFLKSEHIPAVYIDTASGSMDYIHQDKSHRESGILRLYDARGELSYRGNLESIKGRGNSTFFYQEKKPYSLKLTAEADLLGMGKARKWALLANAYDPSQMRNKIVFDFAAQAGLPYTPDSRWVELHLNGEYAGLYLLSEKNEIHPRRVDIPQTGSFLVSMDRPWLEDVPMIRTRGGVTLRVHSTDMDMPVLQSRWQSVENAIRAEDKVDPATGKHLWDLIDLESWARKYLIEEIFVNTDGGRFSQFFYLDGSDPAGKICAGPVWDYDLALSNPVTYREFGDINYAVSRYNLFCVNSNPDSWFYELYRDPDFLDCVRRLYGETFLPLLEKLPEKIQAEARQVRQGVRMNAVRWRVGPDGDLSRAVAGRTEFLTQVWLENREYVTVRARFVDRNMDYLLSPGENLAQLPVYDTWQWYLSGTDTPADLTAPVYEDMGIELRADQEG